MRSSTPFRAVAFAAAACLTAGITNLCVCSGQSTSARNGSPSKQNPQTTSQSPVTVSSSAPGTVKPSPGSVAPARKEGEIDRHMSRGESLARSAMAYRGAPYRFGSRSGGFDCSGLMQTVCAKYGVFLPRAANSQFSVGTPVPKEQIQPGDLVFFQNTYKRGISHVGIYIGDGQFLHAAGSRKGVVVSRLDEGYHKQHYAGARRLDLSKLPHVPGEEKIDLTPILDEKTAGGGAIDPAHSETKPSR